MENPKKRCRRCNMKNPLYVEYHDREWGQLRCDDHYLFEMLVGSTIIYAYLQAIGVINSHEPECFLYYKNT